MNHKGYTEKLHHPVNTGKFTETKPGATGILINGVEILNYKSKDFIQYGSVEDINVISPGIGFDVINHHY